MTDHLSQNQIDDYCGRKLSAIELLSVSDHLAVCDLCRGVAEEASDGDRAFFALRSEVFGDTTDSPHATTEKTVAYVDGLLSGDELQTVNDHLHRCEECTRLVDDLRAFKDQIGNQINIPHSPVLIPVQSGKTHRRLFLLPSFAVSYQTFAIGAALTILIVAVIGWLIWRGTQTQPVSQDEAVSPPRTQQESQVDQIPIIAQLNDAEGRLTLNQAGQLSGVDRLPADYQTIIKEALTNQRIDVSPSLKGLVRAGSPLMSSEKDGSNFSVIEPVGKVLLTDRPQFRWSPLAGANNYVVEIYDSELTPVTASSELTTHSWEPPKSLLRGRMYSWQVKAIKDDKTVVAPRPPAPQARFRIVDSTIADEIAEARRSYASSHLLLGMLYAKAGLLDEARKEFHELQKANPDSEIARKLLGNLTQPRRRR